MGVGILGGRDPEEIAEAICSQCLSDAQSTIKHILRELDRCVNVNLDRRVQAMDFPKGETRALIVSDVGALIRRVDPDVHRVSFEDAKVVLVAVRRRLQGIG